MAARAFEPDYEAIARVEPDVIFSLGGPEHGLAIVSPTCC